MSHKVRSGLDEDLRLPGVKRGKVRDVRKPKGRITLPKGGGFNRAKEQQRSSRTAAIAGANVAVVKITGYSNGSHKNVRSHINYITRNGKLDLEREDGKVLNGRKVSHEIVRAWGEKHLGPAQDKELKGGKFPRKAAHLMLSIGAHGSEEKMRDITRDFLHQQYGDVTRYAFSIHADTKHIHAHVVLAMRGYDGRKLRIGPDDLQQLRENFAAVSTKHGVAMVASRRVERGLDQGDSARRSNVDYRQRQRQGSSVSFRAAVSLAYRQLTGQAGVTKAEARYDEEASASRKVAQQDAAYYRTVAQTNPSIKDRLLRAAELHDEVGQRRQKSAMARFRELVISVIAGKTDHPLDRSKGSEPSAGMRALAETIAKEKGLDLPQNYATDFSATREFLNQHAKRAIAKHRALEPEA